MCAIKGEKYKNKEAIRNFLDKLEYPIYYLDYETMSPPIPKFKGMRPYQRIPFQYSLHIQRSKGAKPDRLRFIQIPRNFKGVILYHQLRRDFLDSLENNER